MSSSPTSSATNIASCEDINYNQNLPTFDKESSIKMATENKRMDPICHPPHEDNEYEYEETPYDGYNRKESSYFSYGYNDTTEQVVIDDYGYPTSTTTTAIDDDPLMVDYGYGETEINNGSSIAASPFPTTTMPTIKRRSSLTNGQSEGQRRRRRASISYKGEIEVCLPDHSVVRRRRSIGFQEDDDDEKKNRVYEVDRHTEHTDKDELWYSPEECDRILMKNAYLVQYTKLVGMDKVKQQHLHTRGLERHINFEEYQEHNHLAKFVVLDEQEHQRENRFFDDEMIGELYGEVTMDSQAKAHALAKKDYAEIAKEHQKLRKAMRRASM
jgi:hypothetical protein